VADAQAGDNTSQNLNRRRFLGAAATTFATLALAPSRAHPTDPANGRLTLL